MNDYLALQAINVISDLLRHSLAENHPEPKIYNKLVELIDKFYTKKNWAIDYINFELLLLQELGYGLDLRNCAVTGETENLTHISPKTGRSVSEPVAQNYLDRLLALPKFLINPCFNYNTDDLIAGFKITSYFLEKKMLNLSKKLPLSRKIFIDKILNTN